MSAFIIVDSDLVLTIYIDDALSLNRAVYGDPRQS